MSLVFFDATSPSSLFMLDKYVLSNFLLQFVVVIETFVVVASFCRSVSDDDGNWEDEAYSGKYTMRSPPDRQCAAWVGGFDRIFGAALLGSWVVVHLAFLLLPSCTVACVKRCVRSKAGVRFIFTHFDFVLCQEELVFIGVHLSLSVRDCSFVLAFGHVYVHLYKCACFSSFSCVYENVNMYMCMRVCKDFMCIRRCICVCVCVCVCVCLHMDVYVFMPARA